jgi:hypothetical protein
MVNIRRRDKSLEAKERVKIVEPRGTVNVGIDHCPEVW